VWFALVVDLKWGNVFVFLHASASSGCLPSSPPLLVLPPPPCSYAAGRIFPSANAVASMDPLVSYVIEVRATLRSQLWGRRLAFWLASHVQIVSPPKCWSVILARFIFTACLFAFPLIQLFASRTIDLSV
jgi:hypothetical protein